MVPVEKELHISLFSKQKDFVLPQTLGVTATHLPPPQYLTYTGFSKQTILRLFDEFS